MNTPDTPASGMINFMRNIGSGIGTSVVTTMIARRAQYHQAVLIEDVTSGNPIFLKDFGGLQEALIRSGYRGDDAQLRAHASLYRTLQQQTATLAYIDAFWALGFAAAVMFALCFTLRKNDPGQGETRAEG